MRRKLINKNSEVASINEDSESSIPRNGSPVLAKISATGTENARASQGFLFTDETDPKS